MEQVCEQARDEAVRRHRAPIAKITNDARSAQRRPRKLPCSLGLLGFLVLLAQTGSIHPAVAAENNIQSGGTVVRFP